MRITYIILHNYVLCIPDTAYLNYNNDTKDAQHVLEKNNNVHIQKHHSCKKVSINIYTFWLVYKTFHYIKLYLITKGHLSSVYALTLFSLP